MPFGSLRFPWNGVDVREADGLLHHGRVINAVPGGLVVDFDWPKKSGAKLVPFGSIYHCIDYDDADDQFLCGLGLNHDLTEERPVEVLVRAKPNVPWKWHPGTLLMGDYYTGMFGLVNVTLPGGTVQGIVYGDRIRAPSPEAGVASLRVDEGMFSSKLVLVPRDHGAYRWPDDVLISTLNVKIGRHGMMATHVIFDGLFKQVAILGTFDKPGRSRWFTTKDGKLDSQLLLSMMKNDDDAFFESIRHLFPTIPTPDGNISGLCQVTLAEVFECLTAVEQSRLCGTCRKWEPILTSARVRRVFVCSRPTRGMWGIGNSYADAACMYNCLSQRTKTLVLHREASQSDCRRLTRTTRLLERILAERRVPAFQTVLVVDRSWYVTTDDANWLAVLHGELVSLTAVCQQVVITNVSVVLELYRPDVHPTVELVVRIAHQRINSQFTTDGVWAMLNSGLSDLEVADMECLSEWIRHVCTNPTTDLWTVVEVLHMTQTSDPRAGVRYRGMAFYPYGSDHLSVVDTEQLTNLTLHFLLQRYKQRGVERIFFNIQ